VAFFAFFFAGILLPPKLVIIAMCSKQADYFFLVAFFLAGFLAQAILITSFFWGLKFSALRRSFLMIYNIIVLFRYKYTIYCIFVKKNFLLKLHFF